LWRSCEATRSENVSGRSGRTPVDFLFHLEVFGPGSGIALYDALRSNGYDVEFLEIPEGHSWNAWKSHIDDVLTYLFPGES